MTDMGDKGPCELNFARFFVIVLNSYPRQQLVDVILEIFAHVVVNILFLFSNWRFSSIQLQVYCAFPFF